MSKLTNFVKQIAYWTLPLGVENLVREIYPLFLQNFQLSADEKAILARNKELRDRHKGERCFILATGSSIKKQDLTLLKDEICIAVSNFYLHPAFQIIKPKYYCIAPWHPPHQPEDYIELLQTVGAIAKESTFFLGISEYQKVRDNNINLGCQINYLKFGGFDTYIVKRGINLTLPLLNPISVSIIALQVAICMGFSEIYLLGFDHDSILNRSGSFANKHFYNENEAKLITDTSTFKQELLALLDLWSKYEILEKIIKKSTTQILNVTDSSLLDIFTKKAYTSLF